VKHTLARLGLAYYAAMGLTLGIYASLAPKHYFEHFPGAGHAWVVGDGPYNEHLMRDYGALNLALGVLALCAVAWMTRELIIATAAAEIMYAVPHVIYHLSHPSRLGETSDQFGAIGGLAIGVVIGGLLLFYTRISAAPEA
jgi:hypothetical protein